jgi:hypothetical protein
LTFEFRLGDQAIAAGSEYSKTTTGSHFRALSENEQRMCERMAVANRLQDFVFYIQARLPDNMAFSSP